MTSKIINIKSTFKVKAILFIITILLAADNNVSFVDDIVKSLNDYYSKFPQEKIYLQLDKNIYQSGDSLWFKAYMLDYQLNYPSSLSQKLNIAIIDREGKIILKNQTVIINGEAKGKYIFPKALPEGKYKILAYSSWMKNFDISNIQFSEFQIKNFLPKNFFLSVQFLDSLYKPGDKIRAELVTMTNSKYPIPNVKYDYLIQQKDQIIFKGNGKTSGEGTDTISYSLPISDTTIDFKIHIEAFRYIDINVRQKAKLETYIPIRKSNIDLQFFPEGGNLIDGLKSKVAFKAIDELGNPFDFEGELLDNSNNIINKIKTGYKGMGAFIFTPSSTKKYKVRIIKPEGIRRLYHIPSVMMEGYVISLEKTTKDQLSIAINSSDPNSKEKIAVLAQVRGIKYWSIEGEISDKAIINIPTTDMPAGIAQITLFNSNKIPLAERLVFVNKHKKMNIVISSDKNTYKAREKVKLTLMVSDETGNPLPAHLSLSVVDKKLSLNPDKHEANILSSILLNSELKGRIITPNFYFEKNNPKAEESLDYVLMTHGWRRFSWDSLFKVNLKEMSDPQNYDLISGTVFYNKTVFKPNKLAANSIISVTQLNPPDFIDIQTDEKARFSFSLDFSNYSNKLGLVARSSKNRTNVRIDLDEEVEDPFRNNLIPYYTNNSKELWQDPELYPEIKQLVKNTEDISFDFGDSKLIQPVTIIAKRYEKTYDQWARRFNTYTDYIKTGDDLIDRGGDFIAILKQVDPFIRVDYSSGQVFYNRSSYGSFFSYNPMAESIYESMIFVVNDIFWSDNYIDLNFLTPDMIECITVVGNIASLYYGSLAAHGAVFVTTKGDYIQNVSSDNNIITFNYLAPVKEFYSPKYESHEEISSSLPDLRTTIYWDPDIYIDESGIGIISFYNADREATIKGIIEGVNIDGLLGIADFHYSVVSDKKTIFVY